MLFDAGGTLYRPVGGRWNPRFDFEEVLLRHHPDVSEARFQEAFEAGDRFMDEAPSTPPRDAYHRAVLRELGVLEPSERLLEELRRPLDDPVVELYPDVLPALEALREGGVRMAVVSDNWVGVEALLDELALLAFFDAVVVSEAVGARKPDPRMYRAGSDALGLAPDGCLFVDDDPDLVRAAVDLGYRGVIIDREDTVRRPDVDRIDGLDELMSLLRMQAPHRAGSPDVS